MPWNKYQELANSLDISLFRLPMIDGGCPSSFEDVNSILERIHLEVEKGRNGIVHCRGGVGRAGLVACCYLLKYRLCGTHDDAIRLVRRVRHPKAVETRIQEQFIERYANRLKGISQSDL